MLIERLDAAIDAAQHAEISIFAISTNYEETNSSDIWVGIGNTDLRKLASETGGRLLRPSGPQEVSKAFGRIVEELRARYVVSYRPAHFLSDGHYRRIRIEARKNEERLQVRARKGYYARGTPSGNLPLAEPEQSNLRLISYEHTSRWQIASCELNPKRSHITIDNSNSTLNP